MRWWLTAAAVILCLPTSHLWMIRSVRSGSRLDYAAEEVIDGAGYVLAPGFIDVHTHDDTNGIRTPEMLPKLSQGVTTVIVGNCGISAAPVRLVGDPPDPMNLLGDASVFRYPTFAAYVAAVEAARPAVNVAALVGHTALRNNHMDRLDRAATKSEIEAMRLQLIEALDCWRDRVEYRARVSVSQRRYHR